MAVTLRLVESSGSSACAAALPVLGGGFGPPSMLLRGDVERHADILRQHLGWRLARLRVDLAEDGSLEHAYSAAGSLRGLGLAPWLVVWPGAGQDARGFGAAVERLVAGCLGEARRGSDGRLRVEVVSGPDSQEGSPEGLAWLERYDAASAGAKRACASAEVGGPGSSDPQRLDAFLAHVFHRSPPEDVDHPAGASRCDFVSVELPAMRVEPLAAARALVNVMLPGDAGKRAPVVCSSFDRSPARCDTERDRAGHAAAVARFLIEAGPLAREAAAAGASDILDDPALGGGLRYEPLHGGPGVLTVHDLPKPTFHALDWLRRLGEGDPVEVAVDPPTPGLTVSASRQGNAVRLLVANDAPEDQPQTTLRLAGWPGATAEVLRVSAEHGSAWARWRSLGAPDFLNDDLLGELTRASLPEASSAWLATESLAVPPGSLTWIETQAA
ncbi:MAG: hypothetical protein AAGA57_08595 [Planctomycetota bacterium]